MYPPQNPPSKPSKKKWLLFVAGALAVGGAIYMLGGLGKKEAAPQARSGVPVETATVTPKRLQVNIDAVGTLVANEMVMLRPEIAGRITEVLFTEGQPVKKGDPLFKIDDRMARAELKQAESNLQLARLNYDRFRKLSSTGAATKLRYDEARAELGVNQANADLARTRVEYMTISAPFDGVVGLRSVSPGEYVNVGQELANFVSYDPMKVNFTIPETQASQLAEGQTIAMTVEALPGRTFEGVVYALDPQLDVNGRAVNLRATIPNPENVLKPGFFARIALNVANKENALTVPESAIVPQGNTKQVFVVGEDQTANLVTVELGERLAGEVEVVSGLQAGDVVVTSGQIKLQPGAKVTNTSKAPEAAAEAPQPAAGNEPQNAMSTADQTSGDAVETVLPAEQQPIGSEPGSEAELSVPTEMMDVPADEGAGEAAPEQSPAEPLNTETPPAAE